MEIGAQASSHSTVTIATRGRFQRYIILLGGVVLPTLALMIEAFTKTCGSAFFDPIPTPFHAGLIAAVPLVNLILGVKIKNGAPLSPLLMGAVGASMLTSVLYSMLFIPIMPFAAMYTALSFSALFLPAILTLLPFAPVTALLATVHYLISSRSATLLPARAWVSWGTGAILAFVVFTSLEVPRVTARIGSERLAANPADQNTLTLMRVLADRETLLRAAYFGAEWSRDFVGWMEGSRGGILGRASFSPSAVSIEASREIYYRITGEHFATKVRPTLSKGSFLGLDGFDEDQGGKEVGGMTPSVLLASSTLDGSIDAAGAVAYLEWSLTFTNSDSTDREARFEVLLPAGGVVSRATLWIDGEEREAAVGGQAEARAAYERVVKARRDPLLVTSAAPGRVLVQCFPISAKRGEMKIKLGISTPLALPSLNTGVLTLPLIVAKNFTIPPTTRGSVWLESKGTLRSAQGVPLEPASGVSTLREKVYLSSVDSSSARIEVARDPSQRHAWSNEIGEIVGVGVMQEIVLEGNSPKKRFVIVVDGSSGMSDSRAALADTIRHLPDGVDLAVIIADDKPLMLDSSLSPSSEAFRDARARSVLEHRYVGGIDNAPALGAAWDLAVQAENSEILWVHGDQPLKFSSVAELIQRYKRRPNGPHIRSLAVRPGMNRLIETVELQGYIHSTNDLWEDAGKLAMVVRNLATPGVRAAITRTRAECSPATCLPEDQTSLHLARILAVEEISADLIGGRRAAAVEKALRYRLVTPVSGAVILERKADYVAAGLEAPPEASGKVNIPGVPEPEEWVLLLLSTTVVLLCGVQRLRQVQVRI